MNSKAGIISRRDFLKSSCALCLGSLIVPKSLFAQTKAPTTKSLKLFNINTRKHLSVTYYKNGKYSEKALLDISKIMADRRSGDMVDMDVALLDTLYSIQKLSNSKEPMTIICGYRSLGTNKKLTHSKKGVAKNSYHTLGQAADIKISGIPLKRIKQIAESLNAGGVGYYPKSGFVHVDVGPARSWHG
ncbi:MAG: DUF882 domain-containing protein [Sulfurimonas sp.]|nr:DUF882 domain-containing protein [Sulfurimonas sp.]